MPARQSSAARLAAPFLIIVMLSTGFGCRTAVTPAAPGQAGKTGEGAYRSLTATELQQMLLHKDFLLIDVHSQTGPRIQGTDLYVPYDNVQGNLPRLPSDKAARIVVYCQSGYMSAIAAKALAGFGYTNVFDLSGGMLEWQRKGYTLTEETR